MTEREFLESPGARKFRCDECGMLLPSAEVLAEHSAIHVPDTRTPVEKMASDVADIRRWVGWAVAVWFVLLALGVVGLLVFWWAVAGSGDSSY